MSPAAGVGPGGGRGRRRPVEDVGDRDGGVAHASLDDCDLRAAVAEVVPGDLVSRATRAVVSSALAAAVALLGGVSPSVAAPGETRVPGDLRLVSPINVDVADDSYIWSTWRARKIITGTTLIMKVKRCNGSWDTRRVPYVTGSLTINISSPIVYRYPRSAPVKGILVQPDHQRTVTYSGRMPFGSRFGRC